MKIEIKNIISPETIQITTTDERWYQEPKSKEWWASSTWIASYVPSKELAIWMAKKGWDEAELIKQEAGARGSRIHKGIEILSTGGEVNHNDCFTDGEGDYKELSVQEYEAIISFNEWVKEARPKFLATEKTVFNSQYKYAGTTDCLAVIDGVTYLIDYKTSANIYLSHEVQLASYLHADKECFIKVPEKIAILQVGYARNKKKFKFTEIDDKFDLFLAAMKFWAEENQDKKPLQKDFPTKIKLGV